MKTKTTFGDYRKVFNKYGIFREQVWFELYADVRWVNVWGKELGEVNVDKSAKLIGDE